jgi:lipopolysaccharide transport system ATP-binding protein
MSSDASNSDVVVSVRDVGKCYHIYSNPRDRLMQTLLRGRRQFYREFWALRDVNLEVRRGETVAVIGRNGSGKSTLLQIIAGTLAPTTGQVRTTGRIAALLELGSGFNPEYTGRENVFLNGAILGLSRAEILDRFDSIAAFADIGDFLDQPVKTYSSGMMVRLAFAVQVQVNPDVLLVDEALAVGDERFQRKCYGRLEELRGRGTAVLLVTHATNTVEVYCDRALLLERGAAHGVGSSKTIVDQYHALLYADEQAYLRMINQTALEEASRAVAPPVGAPVAAPAAVSAAEPAIATALPEAPPAPVAQEPSPAGAPRCRALIEDVWIHAAEGTPETVFVSGQDAEIGFSVRATDCINELRAGIRIRTIEGAEVYGTSTGYFGQSVRAVQPGSRWKASFRINLWLCPGTYFVSVAIAESISNAEMLYLDKRTDVLMFKVKQPRLTGTGIANLRASVALTAMEQGQP